MKEDLHITVSKDILVILATCMRACQSNKNPSLAPAIPSEMIGILPFLKSSPAPSAPDTY